jgi:DNA-binding transcriptional MocR family regulator
LLIWADPYGILELPDYQPLETGRNYEYPGIAKILPTLFSLDDDGRVLYLYTFSKILAPSIRLGFAAGSKQMISNLIFYNECGIHNACGLSQGCAEQFCGVPLDAC